MASLTKPLPGLGINYMHPLARGLVAWFLCNEGGGSRIVDARRQYHGSMTNMATESSWTGSQQGGAILFGGTDDYINVTEPLGSDVAVVTDYPFTLSAWVMVPSTAAAMALLSISNPASAVQQVALMTQTNGTVTLSVRDSSSFDHAASTTTLTPGRWHHVCGVAHHSTFREIYLDATGRGETTGAMTAVSWSNTNLGRLGDNSPSNFLVGALANVRIYNRALSALDVQQLHADPYAALLPPPSRWANAVVSAGTLTPGHTYQHRRWAAHHISYTP